MAARRRHEERGSPSQSARPRPPSFSSASSAPQPTRRRAPVLWVALVGRLLSCILVLSRIHRRQPVVGRSRKKCPERGDHISAVGLAEHLSNELGRCHAAALLADRAVVYSQRTATYRPLLFSRMASGSFYRTDVLRCHSTWNRPRRCER